MDIFSNYDKYITEYYENSEHKIYKMGRLKNKTVIDFVPCGFDIETTTQYKKDEKGHVTEHTTNMYIWQFSFSDYVFFGRTWSDFNKLIISIEKNYCKGNKFLFFIHNMGFEMSFVIRELIALGHNVEVFARKKRHPLKVTIDNSIIILDSMLLTGYSLEKLAKNFTTTQKLKGDLDYNIIRNSKTPISNEKTNKNGISKKELDYCRNDVVILKEYAELYEQRYLKNNFLPMTSTMIASNVVKQKIKELDASKEKYFLISNAYPKNWGQYNYEMNYYTGAYTHGMLKNLFTTHNNVLAYDVTSEYSYCLFLDYPVGKPHQIPKQLLTKEGLEKLGKDNCVMVEVEYKNIRTKTGVTILSKNKIIAEKPMYDNGRLYKAESCFSYLTDIDLKTIDLHYEYDGIIFKGGIYAKRGKLPKYFLLAIAELYVKKCTLKGIKGLEVEYMQSKIDLNGQYGSIVCRVSDTEIALDEKGNWTEKPHENDFSRLAKTKTSLPLWGAYCTAHARFLILSTIAKLDLDTYYYTDTDSIKCGDTEHNRKVFKEVNDRIRTENANWIERLELKKLYPSVDFSEMGTFAYEGTYKRFKTLGAKRYLVEEENGEIIETVAGLPKGVFTSYCKNRNLDPFETFNEKGISISEDETKKLCSYYCDNTTQFEVVDYLGNKEEITAESYVSLIPTPFNLGISRDLELIYNRISDKKGQYR